MEGYLVALPPKIGQKRRKIIVIMEMQMIKPGYFLFTTGPSSKLNKNSLQYAIINNI
jgi:hypothetical protein